MISDKDLRKLIEAAGEQAMELETAAKVAAQNGMYESGAALRNKADGVRIVIEALNQFVKE